MSYGPVKVFAATMASAGTTTSEVDLGQGWNSILLEIPTLTSNSVHFIKVSNALSAAGGVYRRLSLSSVQTATIQTNTFTVQSTATNVMVAVPVSGFRYAKVESEVTINDGAIYKFICGF